MQKVRYSLLIFGIIILIADLASVNFNNLSWSENWLNYLIFIAMTATLVSVIQSIRSANKSENQNF
ncbi:hypothetical protein [Marinilabilia salmonicolor]|jgi:hypothetical protein|uniref:Uncharacterized protein n=1 Tax=Marinilabilia salmonicolor TaxID=989 RepID=A0A368UJW7_9BACT|nr:hypothetical protein [Marinilabilia salmonicolor]RCW28953.1 hypothetical protein DFO77_1336 [Marinilabilia salmonicolor]